MFNISYHPVFQNIRNILQELYLLLAPDTEHKKVCPNVRVVGFCNVALNTTVMPKTNETRRCETWAKTCLVCNLIRTTTTFITVACRKTSKIQSGPLNCDSEKVLYLLKCKVW